MSPAAVLEGLNEAQRRAVTHGAPVRRGSPPGAGPLLVIAGAGTGKTMTLAHRVGHLVLAGVPPQRILLLTFSRRAAREMTRRARRVVGQALADQGRGEAVHLPWAGTFHSVANRLLREFAPNLALDAGFSVLDRGDAADLMDVARQELGLADGRRRFPRKDTCLAIYSRVVNARAELADCLEAHWPWCGDWTDELRTLFGRYVELKQSASLLDYDDLLLWWHALMEPPALAAAIGERFDHVLVDEYQDTNLLQAEILLRLKPEGRGLTVVGDDAQGIYSFRAAEVENILRFPGQFEPPAAIVTLEENYRSVQPVLDAANALMAGAERQFRKALRSARPSAQKPFYVTVPDDEAQADYVINAILVAREAGQLLRQQAVLFRASHHSDRLELELVRRNIPFVKYGGLKFLEAAHVKDLLAVLRWADNPKNRVAAFRCLQLLPGVGPALAARAFGWLESHGFEPPALGAWQPPPAAAPYWAGLVALLAEPGPAAGDWHGQVGRAREWYRPQLERLYEEWPVRLGDLDALEQIAGKFATREQFLTELSLDPPQATGDLAGPPLLDEDYLVLSTIHSAKGQEWDSVYILNVADGNFPSEFATGKPALIEEERRLLYVAMTRAKSDLHLVAPLKYWVPQQPRHGDRHVYGARSRFIDEAMMARLEPRFHGPAEPGAGGATRPGEVIDVAARMRNMW
ncbi:ATP-dependent helicase [Thioalkalivibrio sp. XN8]|uniref:ATP-dependent helicase n=1 Tax=Thioalkalivibrio sp. XN8 TaxID=2712863 RepID=UPI0013EB09DE|nr:ATP-dependent helicase [Thioalkalivibrio sp. XN8]NGP53033.1 ATP-dependent helicase [Thioalkalivibrio sp. XN8]